MDSRGDSGSERVLIWTPFGKDGVHLFKVLSAEKFDCCRCADVNEVVGNFGDVDVIITTDEALSAPSSEPLIAALRAQPSWSAVPILAFFGAAIAQDESKRRATHPLQMFADISFLQRPVLASTLIDATTAALRDRKRQYQIKHLLELLEQDISQKEKYEAELKFAKQAAEKEKEAALSASSSKSQFLANMSHEIRTPLGAIIGFLELLKSPSNTRSDIENYISVIDRNSVQLLRLIDDILDLSKVEAGKLAIEHIEFSLVDVVADCASLMGFKAREKGIFFELILETDLPNRVISDPTRLRQVIVNIVGNAIKFTEHGKVDMFISYRDGVLEIRVSDTGRGISDEQRQRLFQAFSQADNSTTRYFGGTGLGLVLTRYLCEAMGGSFNLGESALGVGSTFTAMVRVGTPVQFEMVHQTKLEAGKYLQSEEERRILEGRRILIVEDSPDNQALFTIFLTKVGALVDVASNGEKGVERALKSEYDIVLMDIQMPVMDGHTATQLLRRRGFLKPIIALTAHAMKEERERTARLRIFRIFD